MFTLYSALSPSPHLKKQDSQASLTQSPHASMFSLSGVLDIFVFLFLLPFFGFIFWCPLLLVSFDLSFNVEDSPVLTLLGWSTFLKLKYNSSDDKTVDTSNDRKYCSLLRFIIKNYSVEWVCVKAFPPTKFSLPSIHFSNKVWQEK